MIRRTFVAAGASVVLVGLQTATTCGPAPSRRRRSAVSRRWRLLRFKPLGHWDEQARYRSFEAHIRQPHSAACPRRREAMPRESVPWLKTRLQRAVGELP
jgi:hypothetical protein